MLVEIVDLPIKDGGSFHTHRILGAAIYGAPWIPSIYPLSVSIDIPAPWIRHGIVMLARLPGRVNHH